MTNASGSEAMTHGATSSQSTAQAPSRLAPTPVLPTRPTEGDAASTHSHSSDSSHSSHSSVQARKRREAFGSDELPSVARPAWSLLAIVVIVAACHAVGIWIFTRGFLLTRSETQGVASCPPIQGSASARILPKGTDISSLLRWDAELEANGDCSLAPVFERSVILIIDALRYDFIAPVNLEVQSDWKPNPFYHGHLDEPVRLDQAQPRNSILAHFLSDAPTTTLQRLKGLTTGSLPTFIDAGSNFGAEAITEDNWIAQFRSSLHESQSSKPRFALMGDDTWLKVYPHLFDANWTWPFDSFNVEDLHSVDAGVEQSIQPFLDGGVRSAQLTDWRLIVAHTLGLDHVGHRHTPAHSAMTAKLKQMNQLVAEVARGIPEDSLLVLAGDHGMDAQGDHGGEGELEVGSGIWIYSKRGFSGPGPAAARRDQTEFDKDVVALQQASRDDEARFGPASHNSFSPLGKTQRHRTIPQTDIVPSLALSLGATPPFGNLGTVIPELFPPSATQSSRLVDALRINARQIRRYLYQYGKQSSELKSFERELHGQMLKALHHDAAAALAKEGSSEFFEARRQATVEYQRFNRLAMHRARSVWAKFNLLKIATGLVSLALSVATGVKLLGVSRAEGSPEKRNTLRRLAEKVLLSSTIGTMAGTFSTIVAFGLQQTGSIPIQGVTWVEWLAVGSTMGAQIGILFIRSDDTTNHTSSRAQAIKEQYRASQIASKTREDLTTRSRPKSTTGSWLSDALALSPILLYSVIFASNSFTVWEDSIVHSLLISVLLVRAWRGWSLGVQVQKRSPNGSSGIEDSPSSPSMASAQAIAHRAKQRIPFLLGLSAFLVRATRSISVCREEQAPKCTSGFFHLTPLSTLRGGETPHTVLAWLPPLAVLASCYALSYILPNVLVRSLKQSRSDTALVRFWADWLFRPSLMLGSGWWIVDWIGEGLATASTTEAGNPNAHNGQAATVSWGKNFIARADFALLLVVGISVWFFAPLCLEIKEDPVTPAPPAANTRGAPPSPPLTAADAQAQQQRRVQLLGFSNAFGSSYLLFFSLIFALCWIVSPPVAQLSLAASFIIFIALADAGDAERDLYALDRLLGSSAQASKDPQQQGVSPAVVDRTPTILETTTLHLLGYSLFFATGHQATFLSIQWRSAFVGISNVTYPWSPLLVILNTFGPLVLLPCAALPLLLSWNLAPVPRGPTSRPMTTFRSLLTASISLSLTSTIMALSSAIFAAHFRRHLMLFKVWAPRYMLSAAGLVGVDICLIVAIVAWSLVASKVATTLGSVFE